MENDFETFSRMSAQLPVTIGNQRVFSTLQFPSSDFENWPAFLGAPWNDANGDGIYNIEEGDFPDILGDQFHWYVMSDADTSNHRFLWGTSPLNIEIQTSLFGYDQTGPLGNIIFIRSVIINKSSNELDSVFISLWRDDDIGNASDDLVGCDPVLGLGFTYNDTDGDNVYGEGVPAVGSDFFQGPLVFSPGSRAEVFTWDLENGYYIKEIEDRKMLSMTSFVKYISGNPIYRDPYTAEEAFRYMNGFIGLTGDPFIDPFTQHPSKFIHSGDPVRGTGWLDGVENPPGDRRLLMSSGPFYFAPGDTQEVVGSIIVAGGSDWAKSITKLRYFDKMAQSVFDAGFTLCTPPLPKVKTSQLDNKIVLTFQDGSDIVENYTCGQYVFEGYNVYQGESSSGPWHRIATYDKVNGIKVILDQVLDETTGELIEVPSQFGTDSGLEHYINITYDEVQGSELINHRRYYFSVNAYAYARGAAQRIIESPFNPVVVIPGPPGIGESLESLSGDTLVVSHINGISDAHVVPLVIDPYALSGDTYEITFFESGETVEERIKTSEYGTWNILDDSYLGENLYHISGITEGATNNISIDLNMIWYEEQIITQEMIKISTEMIGDTLIITYVMDEDTVIKTISEQGGPISVNYTDESGRLFSSLSSGSTVFVSINYQGPDGDLISHLSGTLYGDEESNYDFVTIDISFNRNNLSGTFVVSFLDYNDEPLQPYWRMMNKSDDEVKVISHTDVSSGSELTLIDGFKLTVNNGTFDLPPGSDSWEQIEDADGDTLSRIVYLSESGTWADFLRNVNLSGGSDEKTDLQKDIRFVFTDTPQKGYYWDGVSESVEIKDVPFEVWTVEDSVRINVFVWVITGGQEVIHYEDDLINPATGQVVGTVGKFWNGFIVPIYEPYNTSVSYSPWREGSESLGWMMKFDFRTASFIPGDELLVKFTNPIFPGIDSYKFEATGLIPASKKLSRKQMDKVNVFPNPYLGINLEEKSPTDRFVTFTHLGAGSHAVRIFTLSGDLVKKIKQTNLSANDPSNLIRWDLLNSAGNYVASGIYLVYIESKTGSGTFEKILKLAVLQPEIPLSSF